MRYFHKTHLLILAICIILLTALGWTIHSIQMIAVEGPEDRLTKVITSLHLNIWDWVAIIIALASLSVSGYNTYAQYVTMKNTSTLNPKMIWIVMLSLYHNILRNTIMLYALRIKMNENEYKSYPSEDILDKMNLHFLQLEQIPILCMEGKNYYNIKGMIELTEIFNVHLKSTQKHLMSSLVQSEIKSHDVNNLISLNWMLACNLYSTMISIYPVYAGKKDPHNMHLNKTSMEVRNYLLNLLSEYTKDHSFGQKSVDETLRSDCKEFVSHVFGEDKQNTEIFLERLESVINSRIGNREDGLPYIILIQNSQNN